MSKTKWLVAFFLPLLLVSFLQSQSLADLAKKEKARRAALKGKTATVITTADLAKVKKRPAVESTNQEQAVGETAEAAQAGEAGQAAEIQGQVQEGVAPPATAEQGQADATGAEAVKPADAQKPAEAPPAETPALSDKDYRAKQADLTESGPGQGGARRSPDPQDELALPRVLHRRQREIPRAAPSPDQ